MKRPLALLACLLLSSCVSTPPSDSPASPSTASPSTASGVPACGKLPREAWDTVDLIKAGGPYPYPDNDDKRFGNYERHLPEQPPGPLLDAVMAEARAIEAAIRPDFPEAAITFEEVLAYPGLAPGGDSELARCCAALLAEPEPIRVAFGTEASCFAARGVPALVCGPGDIAVAHKPDEWIALDQLDRCDTFLRRLVRSLNG